MIPIERNGPIDAQVTIVLAHGAGAGMEHPYLTAIAEGLAMGDSSSVVRFDFPYRRAERSGGSRRPDPMPVLQAAMRDVVAAYARSPFVLAGKSMGGRVATMVADELGARGVVVFGYPFHPPRRPDQLRTEHLETLRTPTLILQGERDPFGTRAEVEGYRLSPAVRVEWLPDGDHSLVPRKRSGRSAEDNFARAIELARAFVRDVSG